MGRTLSTRQTSETELGADLHQEAALRLGAADQRYTTKRRMMVDLLAATDRPLTMQEILASAPGVPQSSAYRNLSVLAEVGVVRRIQGADDNGRFELAEVVSGHHHHHLICTGCGVMTDVGATPKLERALAEAAKAAGESVGFLVAEHRFDLVGLCATCQ